MLSVRHGSTLAKILQCLLHALYHRSPWCSKLDVTPCFHLPVSPAPRRKWEVCAAMTLSAEASC